MEIEEVNIVVIGCLSDVDVDSQGGRLDFLFFARKAFDLPVPSVSDELVNSRHEGCSHGSSTDHPDQINGSRSDATSRGGKNELLSKTQRMSDTRTTSDGKDRGVRAGKHVAKAAVGTFDDYSHFARGTIRFSITGWLCGELAESLRPVAGVFDKENSGSSIGSGSDGEGVAFKSVDIAGSGDSKSNVLTGTPASAKSRNGESDEIGAGVSNELGSSKTGLGHGKKARYGVHER